MSMRTLLVHSQQLEVLKMNPTWLMWVVPVFNLSSLKLDKDFMYEYVYLYKLSYYYDHTDTRDLLSHVSGAILMAGRPTTGLGKDPQNKTSKMLNWVQVWGVKGTGLNIKVSVKTLLFKEVSNILH